MKLTTVWGVLPVLIVKSKDRYGHANGPVVRLPENASVELRAHELFHVKQFYASAGLVAAVSGGIWLCITTFMTPDMFKTLGMTELWAIATAFVMLFWGLIWSNERMQWRRECAAYGESARVGEDFNKINGYARILSTNDELYGDLTHLEFVETRDLIEKRALDGGLF